MQTLQQSHSEGQNAIRRLSRCEAVQCVCSDAVQNLQQSNGPSPDAGSLPLLVLMIMKLFCVWGACMLRFCAKLAAKQWGEQTSTFSGGATRPAAGQAQSPPQTNVQQEYIYIYIYVYSVQPWYGTSIAPGRHRDAMSNSPSCPLAAPAASTLAAFPDRCPPPKGPGTWRLSSPMERIARVEALAALLCPGRAALWPWGDGLMPTAAVAALWWWRRCRCRSFADNLKYFANRSDPLDFNATERTLATSMTFK